MIGTPAEREATRQDLHDAGLTPTEHDVDLVLTLASLADDPPRHAEPSTTG